MAALLIFSQHVSQHYKIKNEIDIIWWHLYISLGSQDFVEYSKNNTLTLNHDFRSILILYTKNCIFFTWESCSS